MSRTPGPWMMDESTGGKFMVFVDNGTDNSPVVADKMREGDARLLAAAPELLSAAIAALECIERHVPATTFAPRERLRAAIATANGDPV